jgi:hypothetical protein
MASDSSQARTSAVIAIPRLSPERRPHSAQKSAGRGGASTRIVQIPLVGSRHQVPAM